MAIRDDLAKFRSGEWKRDQAEMDRDKRRFTENITMLGKTVDMLQSVLAVTKDAATRKQVKARMDEIMTYLKDNPDVKGVDNPSDDAMG